MPQALPAAAPAALPELTADIKCGDNLGRTGFQFIEPAQTVCHIVGDSFFVGEKTLEIPFRMEAISKL